MEESRSALQQMSVMAARTLDLAQKAKDLTNLSRTVGGAAMTDMQAMNTAMDAIKASSDEIAKSQQAWALPWLPSPGPALRQRGSRNRRKNPGFHGQAAPNTQLWDCKSSRFDAN